MPNHLFDGLVRNARPNAPLATLGSGSRLTYADAIAWSGRYANVLTGSGVGPGDRVAVQCEKSLDSVLFYLACLRAGAVYLPLNPEYTTPEVAYFLGNARPRLVVCDPGKLSAMTRLLGSSPTTLETMSAADQNGRSAGSAVNKAAVADGHFRNAVRGPSDLAAILYTSGTTGQPKGAMLTHDNLLSNASALAELWQFASDDVLIHALPVFHTHGLFVAINVTLISGASMHFMPSFSATEVIAAMPSATVLMGVPTFYTRMLANAALNQCAVSRMRLFVSGSAPLLAETHQAFEARTGHRILERYGMTETNMITSNPYEGERRAGTVGMPLPGVEVRITERDSGDATAKGDIGMIEVRGPNVFSGYWEMPEKTAEDFRVDGYFVTGDLGRIDDDGYLRIEGRAKDLIISGGYNIYPKEIEQVLDEHDAVVESAVVGIPDPDLGERVIACIVWRSDPDEAALEALLEERLARFKRPRLFVGMTELPRNAMGKVQKNVLRERCAGRAELVGGRQ